MERATGCRVLSFATLDDVATDVGCLREQGYRRAGRWDLGQACEHLADWMSYPMDGYAPAPRLVRWVLPVLRATIGRRELGRLLADGAFRKGTPTLKSTIHEPGGDANGVNRLLEAIQRLKTFHDEPVPSPLFGPMDRDTCVRLKLLHCAHHLGFLLPEEGKLSKQ